MSMISPASSLKHTSSLLAERPADLVGTAALSDQNRDVARSERPKRDSAASGFNLGDHFIFFSGGQCGAFFPPRQNQLGDVVSERLPACDLSFFGLGEGRIRRPDFHRHGFPPFAVGETPETGLSGRGLDRCIRQIGS